jgi:23S rRNA pseudouridine1911/1915/1917 synthase
LTPGILLEDHHLLVLNKPAPMMTQAPEGVPSLEAWAKEYIREKYAKPAGVYLGIPHRLDRPVTGIVVFCRNSKAAARVHKQFQDHLVRKVYWGLVRGIVTEDAAEWRDTIRKIPDHAKAEVTTPDVVGAKEAITRVRVLHRFDDSTLLELSPQTGRMHQLRLQAATRGFPILGDEIYGDALPFGPVPEHPRDRLIALHARRLTFEHPFRKVPVEIEAALPDYWPGIRFKVSEF